MLLQNSFKTNQVLDAHGWFYTGDIGQWNGNGTLRIIDRRKDIFKLASGDYVAPGKIEELYTQCRYVSQCFVYGDSLKSCLVAIVVPNEELVMERLAIEYRDVGNYDQVMKMFLLQELAVVARCSSLKPFEMVKDIWLYRKEFTVEDGLLTPTLKNKRLELKKFFQNQIDQMYSRLE